MSSTVYRWRSLEKEGTITLPDKALGRGGEGSVYELVDLQGDLGKEAKQIVAKMYHNPEEENRQKKLEAMVAAPPKSESLAWPIATIYSGNKFKGYLMKRIPAETFKEWAIVSNASSRKEETPSFDVRYALTAAANLGIALTSAHKAGHCIGDINESNIFVSSAARVMIVDTDSAQVKSPSGELFKCAVGKPEYTAPELSSGSLRDKTRTLKSDAFGYAVAVFQIISGGYLPTDGVFTGQDDPPSVRDKIKAGWFPTIKSAPSFKAPPNFPEKCIPSVLEEAIEQCLDLNPARRGDSKRLLNALKDVLANLEHCNRVKNHWFDSRDGKKCPWCEAKKKTGVDVWGKNEEGKQLTLQPIDFDKDAKKGRKLASKKPNRNAAAPKAGAKKAPQQPQGNFTEPPKPDMKGNKTILNIGGVPQVRPPLGQVFSSSSKLGFHCINNETPRLLRFWWSRDQYSPNIVATILGLLVGTFISFLFLGIPENVKPYIPESWPHFTGQLIEWISLIAVGTSLLAVLILVLSSLVYKSRQKRYNYRTASFLGNFLRYVVGPVFWGPIGVTFGVIWAAISIVVWIMDEITGTSKQAKTRR